MIGLTITRQLPAGPVIELDSPLSKVHGRLVETSTVRTAAWQSVRAGVTDRRVTEVLKHVEQSDIPDDAANQFALAGLFVRIGRGDVKAAVQFLDGVLPTLADESIDAAIGTLPTLFEWSEVSPTIAFRVTDETRNLRREQREDLFAFVAALSQTCDVRLIATGPERLWLVQNHREDLPGVSEQCKTHHPESPLSDIVAAAQQALTHDAREVTILRTLVDEPSQTATYAELVAASQVSRSRIRQCISQLVDLGLVATFGGTDGKCVELLEAGREFVDTLDSEIGSQRRLDECVSETGQSSQQCRVSPAAQGPPPDRLADQPPLAPRYRTQYLGRPAQVAAIACAEPGTVSTVTAGVEDITDLEIRRTRFVGYDDDRDEAVVAVSATTPLQYAVSLALALASPQFIDHVLTVDRLEEIIDAVPPQILRDARCIGALSEEARSDPQVFRDALVEWGEQLATLTTKLHHGDYDDRCRFRSEIMQSAHGLAGTIAHLLDVAGVELVREIRVPSDLHDHKQSDLAESIAVSAAIQSRYGHFASYRQLFEDREDRRAATFAPEVDAADPYGELIGSFVIRGEDVHRLRSHLERHLQSTLAVHEDAPEFVVPVPLRSADGRTPYSTVATRILRTKNMRPTRAGISLIQALVGSPYDAARALYQLGSEDRPRQLRANDVRYALATLHADRLLPDHAPTVGAVVSALLSARTPVSTAELADAADVAPRSVRRHRATLVALGIVTETGWRLDLSFNTPAERRSQRYPAPITDDQTTFEDLIMEVAVTVTDPYRLGDPDDPLFTELSWGGDPWTLRNDEDVGPWIETLGALVDRDRPPDTSEAVVEMGPALNQQPLTAGQEMVA